MTDDTIAAMDHLRESCAIAAGKAPVVDDAQVTCWATGAERACWYCFNWSAVMTDGRKEWIDCVPCGTVTTFP